MKKYDIIVNPVAGKGKLINLIKNLEVYCKENQSHCQFRYTNAPGHATELASTIDNNVSHLIICGGDGTINEVINGLKLPDAPILGILPIGSGNDFAKELKLSKLGKNLFNKLFNYTTIITSNVGHVSIKNVNHSQITKYFINSCGIGFDAHVAYLNQSHKTLSGLFSYILSIFRAITKLKPLLFDISCENLVEKNIKKILISIGNGKTAGGGLYLTPNAKIDDDKLDITLLDVIPRLKLILKLPLAIFNRLESQKNVQFFRFDRAEIFLHTPYYIHCDGELLSKDAKEISIRVFEKKLKFIQY